MKNKKLSKYEIIIYFIRIILVMAILYLFFSTFFMEYKVVLKTSFNLIFVFSFLSIFYFSFIENNEDRKLLLDIWKIYFPTIFLLFSLVFSIDKYVSVTKLDFYKTNLDYYLKQENKEYREVAFQQYKEAIDNHLNIYHKEELKDFNKKYLANEKNNINAKKYILLYANFLINIINILTLFMFLRCFVELSKFKINIKNSIIYKNGKFIQR